MKILDKIEKRIHRLASNFDFDEQMYEYRNNNIKALYCRIFKRFFRYIEKRIYK